LRLTNPEDKLRRPSIEKTKVQNNVLRLLIPKLAITPNQLLPTPYRRQR